MDPLGITIEAANIAGNALNADLQYKQTKQLMGIQYQRQQNLNRQGANLQYDMWQKTNYPAQMEMLRKAGLNPSLMYAKGGVGGTTGSQTGGSATSGQAPQRVPMNIGNILEFKNMQAQNELLKAQKLNIDADTALKSKGIPKTEAETTGALAGADKAAADAELARANAQGKRIENANTQKQIDAGLAETKAITDKLLAEGYIARGQADSLIKEASLRAIKTGWEIESLKEGINLTKEQTWKIGQEIDQKWQEVLNLVTGLTQKDREIEIRKAEQQLKVWEAELGAKYPGMQQTFGMILKKAYQSLEMLVGGGMPTEDKFKK